MEMYHFVTNWTFHAPIEKVWEKIIDVESYPTYWPSMKKTEIRGPEPLLQAGSIVDYELKGSLPYLLRFSTEVVAFQPPDLMELASSGALMGDGKLLLKSHADGTALTFYWDVGMTNPFFNLLGKLPFIKAVMEKSHNVVMASGYQVLKSNLEG